MPRAEFMPAATAACSYSTHYIISHFPIKSEAPYQLSSRSRKKQAALTTTEMDPQADSRPKRTAQKHLLDIVQ